LRGIRKKILLSLEANKNTLIINVQLIILPISLSFSFMVRRNFLKQIEKITIDKKAKY
jgi:hypothetical protein